MSKTTAQSTALILPTLNAAPILSKWLEGLQKQNIQPSRLILIDSSSTDDTVAIARQAGMETSIIPQSEFSHGGTRQMVVETLSDIDFVIFLTQDAILAEPDSLERLLACFDNEKVGAAYGRQLPRPDAGPIEAHARLFNYPETGRVKSQDDVPDLGIKTAFISNSYAAYRLSSLQKVGGFPKHTVVSEDTYVASRMILAGMSVVYAAAAAVYHSHRLSFRDELKRYFDIGVFHSRDPWIREKFGQAGGEGWKFLRSELRYLRLHKPAAIPSALIRTGLKFLGYKLGNHENLIANRLKHCFSQHPQYFDRTVAPTDRDSKRD